VTAVLTTLLAMLLYPGLAVVGLGAAAAAGLRLVSPKVAVARTDAPLPLPVGEAIAFLCLAWVAALLPLYGSPSPAAGPEAVPGAGAWLIAALLVAATEAPRLLPRQPLAARSGPASVRGTALTAWALSVFALNLVGTLPAGPADAAVPLAGVVRLGAALTLAASLSMVLPAAPRAPRLLSPEGAWTCAVIGAHTLFAATLLLPGVAAETLVGLLLSAVAAVAVALAAGLTSIAVRSALAARVATFTAMASAILVAVSVAATLPSLAGLR
jgi:hypothetical protein